MAIAEDVSFLGIFGLVIFFTDVVALKRAFYFARFVSAVGGEEIRQETGTYFNLSVRSTNTCSATIKLWHLNP